MIGIFPLVAAGVAGVFCAALLRRYLANRRPYQLIWAKAMAMYAVASVVLFVGATFGWNAWWFGAYWLFGAVLTVPFLAGGELVLLARRRGVAGATWVALVVLAVVAVVVVLGAVRQVPTGFMKVPFRADFRFGPWTRDLPRGADVFGGSSAGAVVIARVYSYSAYAFLLLGTLWSAWKMRGAPELRDRFWGTLLIALGATIVAGGSAFAATGILVGFSLTLLTGITVMFLGFLKASGPAQETGSASGEPAD